MAGAKMVDRTNMSLDDIIKMDRKNTKGKPGFLRTKNSVARNVVKKARNSFRNKKPNNFINKNLSITENRQDVRNRLLKNKQMNIRNRINTPNIQKTRNSNFPKQNRFLNTGNRQRLNNRVSSNMNYSVPAFRITTNNERYQSNNRGRSNTRPTNNRNSNFNNYNSPLYSNSRNQSSNYSGSGRRPMERVDHQFSRRNDSGILHRNPMLSRDREYEAMARALIEAHRENRYSSNLIALSQRRYNVPMENRGYPYRR